MQSGYCRCDNLSTRFLKVTKGALRMTADRPPALFLAEAAGLDFLNTLAIPVDAEVEWLGSGEDLLAWLEAAGLLDRAAVDEVRALATAGELDAAAPHGRGPPGRGRRLL